MNKGDIPPDGQPGASFPVPEVNGVTAGADAPFGQGDLSSQVEGPAKQEERSGAGDAPSRQEEIRAKVDRLPQGPGVYLMRGRDGAVFYVGKASNLRARVRSYFNSTSDGRSFVALLDRILYDLDFLVTANEKEALLLENNLIKEHRPRHNVRLRDDKSYLGLRLDTRKKFPRLELVRRFEADGARYFGPYTSSQTARRQIRLLNRHFQLRACTDRTLASRTRPCLQHQIGRCLAPCSLPVDPALYAERVSDVVMYLSGRGDELERILVDRMMAAAQAEAFEEAARLRDLIADLGSINVQQRVVEAVGVNQDVIGIFREGDRGMLCLMTIRRGRLVGAEELPLSHQEFPDPEMISSLLGLRYHQDRPVPDEVLVPVSLEDERLLATWLTERRGSKARVIFPRRGYRRRLVELANENARASWEARATRSADAEDRLERLARRLRLGKIPRRIECFDISNLQGEHQVSSMTVMLDGELTPRLYRSFLVKGASGQDDYAALREVLTRRFARAQEGEEDWDAPDLLLIDGGKGQLGAALAALADLGVPHGSGEMEVAALAKARSGWPSREDLLARVSAGRISGPNAPGSRAAEVADIYQGADSPVAEEDHELQPVVDRVFLPGIKDPIRLRPNTAELFLLARLRDEAHRFAITHHRKLRSKAALRSDLLDVPGVGAKRAKELLRHFGSVRAISEATQDELVAAPGISRNVARALWEHFHPT
ncbi:MAG: excinuclease ABC subunit UvrC [Polyangia bacterium]|jgi:excinuclease ABC subunit C|nr:excinuclease ABC subunit UvrC [Polyangia bacterium]